MPSEIRLNFSSSCSGIQLLHRSQFRGGNPSDWAEAYFTLMGEKKLHRWGTASACQEKLFFAVFPSLEGRVHFRQRLLWRCGNEKVCGEKVASLREVVAEGIVIIESSLLVKHCWVIFKCLHFHGECALNICNRMSRSCRVQHYYFSKEKHRCFEFIFTVFVFETAIYFWS